MTGAAVHDDDCVLELEMHDRAPLAFLESQVRRLQNRVAVPRAWYWRELHNPWSRAAAIYDAWGILDCCRGLAALEPVRSKIGDDIILFDSFWLPDPWETTDTASRTDHIMFPVEPCAGLTVLCALATDARSGPAMVFRSGDRRIELVPGKLLMVEPACCYRIDGSGSRSPSVFGARYFPATCRYLRDATHAAHRALMEHLPPFNFAQMPLWLVAGEDRADNDFVTGFRPQAPFWSAPLSAPGPAR